MFIGIRLLIFNNKVDNLIKIMLFFLDFQNFLFLMNYSKVKNMHLNSKIINYNEIISINNHNKARFLKSQVGFSKWLSKS